MKIFFILLLLFTSNFLQAGRDSCHQFLLQELTEGPTSLDDILPSLRNSRLFSELSTHEFNQEFHQQLLRIGQLSDIDKAKLLQQINSGEFVHISDHGLELLRLSTMDAQTWSSMISREMRNIASEEKSFLFGPYGVHSTLYHMLNQTSDLNKTHIMETIRRSYPSADKIAGGEQNARAALRQMTLAMNPPHQSFYQSLETVGARQSYLDALRSLRGPLGEQLGEMDMDSIFDITKGIRESVDWSSSQVDEVMLVGSYPNGFARAGQSDLDVHFIKDGVGTEQSTRRRLVSSLYEDLYDVYIARRIANMPPGDDYIGTNPREFFNRSPFTFRIQEDQLILRVNQPQLQVDSAGNPLSQEIEFREFTLSVD